MLRFLRLLAWSLITAAIVITGLGGAGYWLYRDAWRPGPLSAARTVVIPARTGVAGIAELLARNGVIRHPLAFRALARLSGRGGALKAGEFEFPAAASEMQALDIIAGGRTVKHLLTIPEGLTSPQVVALVRAAPALTGNVGPVPQEGALLPDTYAYRYGESRKALIARMERSMAHVVAELWRKRRQGLPLASPEQAVILASIIEKETARPEERARIAGVYLNRLRLGMRMQADPTVLFALDHDGTTMLDRPLTHADLSVDSPYNTYRVKGLPPGPIANPGRASLLAVMQPERTEDLYFVADGSGGHVFAKTLAEQNRNIAQYHHAVLAEPDPLPPVAPIAAPAATAPRPHVHRVASHHRRDSLRRRRAERHAAWLRRCRREPRRCRR
jgi:peptidoglycan lytic transglycosylase G